VTHGKGRETAPLEGGLLSDYLYHETERGVLYCGDCLDIIKQLPDESIDCCITSPPYWGLRDYGTAEWIGGSAECDHRGEPMRTKAYVNQNCGTGDDVKNKENCQFYKDTCPKCGAIRKDSQLGLEKTPEQYVSNMVNLFREVRRVLKKDGVLWLNLGDSYAGNNSRASDNGRAGYGKEREGVYTKTGDGLKSKDLVGIPWRVAFALQSDGWYLRQDIIWHKPNPMPESVTDRCTKSHEYIFLMTKSAKYYYDNDAVKEPAVAPDSVHVHKDGNKMSDVSNDPLYATKPQRTMGGYETRNKRSVWTVTTKPFKEAHFATFPPDLILPCVLTSKKDAVILDPFFGSGTTGMVTVQNGRNYVGIDLNEKYCEIAKRRIDTALDQTEIEI
jgi:DNA modification methylase